MKGYEKSTSRMFVNLGAESHKFTISKLASHFYRYQTYAKKIIYRAAKHAQTAAQTPTSSKTALNMVNYVVCKQLQTLVDTQLIFYSCQMFFTFTTLPAGTGTRSCQKIIVKKPHCTAVRSTRHCCGVALFVRLTDIIQERL